MQIVNRRCAGLDVHQASLTVHVRVVVGRGEVRRETRTYQTETRSLEQLRAWLKSEGVERIAMEATGVYWQPVWNVLEEEFELLLVNPAHIKRVPGRKTDVQDAEWIAELLQFGLLRGSFVPPRPIREIRDLTRHRTKLAEQRASVVNRIHKTLQDANIKLTSVASHILGTSGRAMIEALIAGEERPEVLAELAQRRLRSKLPELRTALAGHVREHHRFLLHCLLEQYDHLEQQIASVSQRLEELTRPFAGRIQRLDGIPGVARRSAENILSEVGADMQVFPSAAHLTSWAGLCPGHHESAGRRTSGRTRKGDPWLRRYLTEAAWAAARTKGTYLHALYGRLARRRGSKRAIIAVARNILVAVYYILRDDQTVYLEPGPTNDHLDTLDPEKKAHLLATKIRALGYTVTFTREEDPAA